MIKAKSEILNIINEHMKFSDIAVCNRLKTELDYLSQDEMYAELFIAARGLVMLSRELGYYTNFNGSLGCSLVAYLLGITEVDPMKYNLSFEIFAGLDSEKIPDIHLNFDEAFIPHAKEYIKNNFPAVTIWDFGDNLNWIIFKGSMAGIKRSATDPARWDITDVDLDNMVKITFAVHSAYVIIKKLVDMAGVDVTTIPLDDKKTLDIIASADTFGIPEFDNDFTHCWLKTVKPKTFDDLVRISGIHHGTYNWSGYADDGEKIIVSEIPNYTEIISLRDDIMVYLIEKGIDLETAFNIMEFTRKGKFASQSDYSRDNAVKYTKIMTDAGVPDWYIESCNQTLYLFPKAHTITHAMMSFRIAWFKAHYPAEFQRTFGQ